MAKVIDITDKLNFEEKPKLVIKGVEIEINNKAVDILKITPKLKQKDISSDDIYELYQILFSEESQKKFEQLELDIDDFNIVVMQAAMLIAGVEDSEGEAQTPTTT